MMCIIRRKSTGFTLFELLLAVTLLSILSTLGATGFFKLSSYWGDILLTQRLNQRATSIFAVMALDFENLLSSEVTGAGLRGQRGNYEDNRRFWRLIFEDDQFSLPVEYYTANEKSRDRYLVRYEIERKEGDLKLIRYARPLLSGPDAETATDIFLGVTGMRIKYFDGAVWLDHWEQDGMPKAVQVSLSIMEAMRDDKHLSRIRTFRTYVN